MKTKARAEGYTDPVSRQRRIGDQDMAQLTRVFLSSTSRDLAPYRASVCHALHKDTSIRVVGMENYVARDEPPALADCNRIQDCDVFVGILGPLYGSTPNDEQGETSFTELEYEDATEQDKVRFMFLSSDEFPLTQALHWTEPHWKRERQQAFHAKVRKAHTPAEFSNVEELVREVSFAVGEWQKEQLRVSRKLDGFVGVQAALPLPGDIPDFGGRDRDVAELLGAMGVRSDGIELAGSAGSIAWEGPDASRGDRRVAAVVAGMAGIGKTTLAVHVGQKLKHRYQDGQYIIDLRGQKDTPLTPAEAMVSLLRALHPEKRLPDAESQLESLYKKALQDRRLLLLLDDASNETQVKPLIPAPPAAAIVTSRTKLVLDGGLRRIDLEGLSTKDAVPFLRSLLVGRADLVDDDLLQVAVACGWLPLALRVAGLFLADNRETTAEDYLAALADQQDRRSVQRVGEDASLDVWAVLSHCARELARREPAHAARWSMLSVFPGDFDAPAAGAVWQLHGREAGETLRYFKRQNLVIDGPDPSRYRLHDLMRPHAKAILMDVDTEVCLVNALQTQIADAARHHAIYYMEILRKANVQYKKGIPSLRDGLTLYNREAGNIATAAAWASAHWHQDDVEGVEATRIAAHFPDAGALILSVLLRRRSWATLLEVGLAAARKLGDRLLESRHLGNLGVAKGYLGELSMAVGYFKQQLEICRQISDPRGESNALGNLGNAFEKMGEHIHAIKYHKDAFKISLKSKDKTSVMKDIGNLGISFLSLKDHKRAAKLFNKHMNIAQEIGNKSSEGIALSNLGNIYSEASEPEKAIDCYRKSIKLRQFVGDKLKVSDTLFNLADELAKLDKKSEACDALRECVKIEVEIEAADVDQSRSKFADLLYTVAEEHAKSGRMSEGRDALRECLEIDEKIDGPDDGKERPSVAEIRARLAEIGGED